MKSLYRYLYFWYYRWKYEIPCREEIRLILNAQAPLKAYQKKMRLYKVSFSYTDDTYESSIITTAERYNITRERVRQIIWKVWRNARK